MKKSLLILPLVLLASALALSACGGGSSSSSGGESGLDEAAIEEAIETAATSNDPSKCTEVQTQNFNENETGKTGATALKTCEQKVEEGNDQAESVTVTNVEEVEEGTATAIAEVEGSVMNGQAVAVVLKEEEGAWKLDEFMGFANFDPEALGSALEELLNEEEGADATKVACVAEGIEGMTEEEAEAMIFEKNEEGLEEILAGC